MKKIHKIILVLLMLLSIVTYQFWHVLKYTYDIRIFYPGIALLMLGFTFVIWREQPKGTRFKYFMELFFLLCFSNVIDEALFNPEKWEANEIIVSFLLTIRFIYIIWKSTRNKSQSSVVK